MMADYVVVPKSSMDATADAIREKTGSQEDIEWTQDGFADAIDGIEGTDYLVERLNGTLTSYYSEDVTTVTSYAFNDNQITSVELPNCITISANGFRALSSLTTLKAHKVTTLGMDALNGCTGLSVIVFPNLSSVTTRCVQGMSSLTTADIGTIGSQFSSPSNLKTIIFRKNDVVSLGGTNYLPSDIWGSSGTGGTLYVPQSLISSYQSATNWSTILGYTNNQIKSIESTHTDPNADIDLTLYYADGTPIGGGS